MKYTQATIAGACFNLISTSTNCNRTYFPAYFSWLLVTCSLALHIVQLRISCFCYQLVVECLNCYNFVAALRCLCIVCTSFCFCFTLLPTTALMKFGFWLFSVFFCLLCICSKLVYAAIYILLYMILLLNFNSLLCVFVLLLFSFCCLNNIFLFLIYDMLPLMGFCCISLISFLLVWIFFCFISFCTYGMYNTRIFVAFTLFFLAISCSFWVDFWVWFTNILYVLINLLGQVFNSQNKFFINFEE